MVHSFVHSHTHSAHTPCKVPTYSLGAIRGSAAMTLWESVRLKIDIKHSAKKAVAPLMKLDSSISGLAD